MASKLPERVLTIDYRATGYVHVSTDARIDVRPQVMVLMEYAHEVVTDRLADLLESVAYRAPQRGSDTES